MWLRYDGKLYAKFYAGTCYLIKFHAPRNTKLILNFDCIYSVQPCDVEIYSSENICFFSFGLSKITMKLTILLMAMVLLGYVPGLYRK